MQLWPEWRALAVQLCKKQVQSARVRPGFVVVCGSPQELKEGVPTAHMLTQQARKAAPGECLTQRCTERACPFRPEGAPVDEQNPDLGKEISPEDKEVDLLAQMQAEAEELGVDPGAPEDGDEGEGSEARKRDYLVELWAFSMPAGFYTEVFATLGRADAATVGVLVTGTAHPAAYVAMRRAHMATVVWTARLAAHGLAHGRQIAERLRGHDLAPRGVGGEVVVPRAEFQVIAGPDVPTELQVVEAWDVAQGPAWFEGTASVCRGAQGRAAWQRPPWAKGQGLEQPESQCHVAKPMSATTTAMFAQ
jgi:hypothetical protein